jgi:hypothetical protein
MPLQMRAAMAEVESEEIDHLIRNLTVQKTAVPVHQPAAPPSPHRGPAPATPVALRAISRREDRNPFGRLPDLGELMPPQAARSRASGLIAALTHPRLPDVRRYFRLPGPAAAARVWVCCGVLLGFAMTFWPYPKTVLGLASYVLALGLVVLSGVWGARLSWDARLGSAHTLSLLTTFWAIVLVTAETLPLV